MFKIDTTKVFTAVIISLTVIGFTLNKNGDQQFDWTGRWEIPDMENSSTNFYIILNEEEGVIRGQHCFVASYAIEFASDDDVTLNNTEVIDSETIELDFISQYSMGSISETTGRVRLSVINSDRIKWEVVEMPSSKRPPTPIPHEKELIRIN